MTDIRNAYQLGLAAFEMRQYREAAKLFSEVLDDAPGDTNALEWRARAHFHSASLSKAEADCRTILADHPTETYAHLLLARTLERQSRPEEAAGVRRRLVALTGDDSHAAEHQPLT